MCTLTLPHKGTFYPVRQPGHRAQRTRAGRSGGGEWGRADSRRNQKSRFCPWWIGDQLSENAQASRTARGHRLCSSSPPHYRKLNCEPAPARTQLSPYSRLKAALARSPLQGQGATLSTPRRGSQRLANKGQSRSHQRRDSRTLRGRGRDRSRPYPFGRPGFFACFRNLWRDYPGGYELRRQGEGSCRTFLSVSFPPGPEKTPPANRRSPFPGSGRNLLLGVEKSPEKFSELPDSLHPGLQCLCPGRSYRVDFPGELGLAHISAGFHICISQIYCNRKPFPCQEDRVNAPGLPGHERMKRRCRETLSPDKGGEVFTSQPPFSPSLARMCESVEKPGHFWFQACFLI